MIPGVGNAAGHAGVAMRRVAEEPLARRIFMAVRRASTPRPALAAVADALAQTAAAMDAEPALSPPLTRRSKAGPPASAHL
jgi:hypothetical protein